ncbi:MAG: ABC transporter ATP-binding protein [candidate division WOR-3 bacterium]
MLKVEGLLKIYGRKAVLKDLDFLVEEGERVFILAPNGYGKTTFLKILANIEPFQKGEITIYNTKIPSTKSRRLISYVSERDNLYPGFKIYEILKFVGSFWEIDEDLFENFLGLLNLNPWRKYSEFSKGERTLIRIAIGLSVKAKLYLIDEPLSSLDFVLREKVVRMMKGKGEGTFIFTSHQIDELSDFATRFVFLKNGKFVEETFERDKVKDIYKGLFA